MATPSVKALVRQLRSPRQDEQFNATVQLS